MLKKTITIKDNSGEGFEIKDYQIRRKHEDLFRSYWIDA
jgi:hypothetical protein